MAQQARSRFLYPHIIIALLILVGFWVAFAFIVLVDPLDVYSWGSTPKVDEAASVVDHPELMLPRSADPKSDLLIIGDSTSAIFTPDVVRKAIPSVKRPLNLSYGFPQLGDTDLLLRRVAKRSRAGWIILFVGPADLTPITMMRSGIPTYLLNSTPLDDLRYINPVSMKLALDVARGKTLYAMPPGMGRGGSPDDAKIAAFQTRESMQALKKRLVEARGQLAAQPYTRDCGGQVGVNQVLVPFLREMSARGVRIDVVFTLTSRAVYGQILEDPVGARLFPPDMFGGESMLRRCLVLTAGALPHVTFHAFDDDRMIGDLANYKDAAHFSSTAQAGYIFGEISRGGHSITPATVESYIAKFRRETLAYQGYNSNFPELYRSDLNRH